MEKNYPLSAMVLLEENRHPFEGIELSRRKLKKIMAFIFFCKPEDHLLHLFIKHKP